MANRHRGEIEAKLDGVAHTLCLTLGALAELESAFGQGDMVSLATKFESGRLSARDLQLIVHAGLRAGGHEVTLAEVGAMRAEGGAAGFVRIVSELLQVTFGSQEAEALEGAAVGQAASEAGEAKEATERPFPGRTRSHSASGSSASAPVSSGR